MTVQTTALRGDYTGNGVTTIFAVPFYFLENSHVQIEKLDTLTNVTTTLALTTDYTLTGAGVLTGGTATLLVAPLATDKIAITRNVPYTQQTHYVEGDPFPSQSHEASLDKLTMLAQQLDEESSRAVKAPASAAGFDGELPAMLASRLVATNAAGTGFELVAPSSGSAAELAVDLADTTDPVKGANKIGFNAALAYAAGTVGYGLKTALAFITNLAASSGSSLVGFTQSGTGAVPRTVQDKVRESVSVRDFGAVGDGVADDTAAIQAAIDAAIAQKKPLIIESGNYRITAPLKVWSYSSGFAYFGCTIKGERQAYGFPNMSGYPAMQGAVIIPTFNNLPAIMIQRARGVVIKGVSIIGTNDLYTLFEGVPANAYKLMTVANMNQDVSRDSRYSPSCGICIDPFGTSVPADGGYPGMSGYYVASAVGSSDVTLEDVDIKNFIVGLMLSPNGTTTNNDQVTATNCMFGYCKTGVAGGQDQSRGVNLHSCQYYYSYTAIDGVSYGAQTWAGPKVFGGIGVMLKYLANVNTVRQDVLYASGLYCEGLASIGFYSTAGSQQSPVLFDGCSFHFTDFLGTGPFSDYHLHTSYAPIRFNGCEFGTVNQTNQGPLRVHNPNATVSFDSCTFLANQLGEMFVAPSSGTDSVEGAQVYYNNCAFQESLSLGNGLLSPVSQKYNLYLLSNGYGDKSPCPYGAVINQTQDPTKLLYNGTGWAQRVALAAAAVTVNSPAIGRAVFTAADPTIIKVGDLIYTALGVSNFEGSAGFTSSPGFICIGQVASVVGSVVTLNGIPQSLVNGTYTMYVEWMPRMHAASTCYTNSSTSLTNVSPTNSWKNGHRIKGTGIPAGAYVVSGGGTATLTISKAATASASGVRIYDADIKVLSGTSL